MSKEVRLLGHPVHQMLIVFPLGLLTTSVAFDIAYYSTGNAAFATVSYWTLSAGIIGALLAAVFGFLDWLWIPSQTRAKSVGGWHGSLNLIVALLFIWSWAIRYEGLPPSTTAVTISVIGLLLALFTSWLGGELVVRLGIGVDRDANPNASNSLSHGRPV